MSESKLGRFEHADEFGRSVLGPPRAVPSVRRNQRIAAAITGLCAWPAYRMIGDPDVSGWTEGGFAAIAAMLMASAVIRWSTPHPKALRLSSGLIVLAVLVGLAAGNPFQFDQSETDPGAGDGYTFVARGSAVTLADVNAVPNGATRAEVRARLGCPPPMAVIATPALPCVALGIAWRRARSSAFASAAAAIPLPRKSCRARPSLSAEARGLLGSPSTRCGCPPIWLDALVVPEVFDGAG